MPPPSLLIRREHALRLGLSELSSSMILWVAMLGAMAPPGRRVLRTHESGGDGASKRQTPLEHVDSHKLRAILLRKKGKRDWQAACDTLWWAIEHEPEEVQPIHFNIVLASLAAATEWERCLVLLEHDMPRSGLGLGCGTGQTRTPQPEP